VKKIIFACLYILVASFIVAQSSTGNLQLNALLHENCLFQENMDAQDFNEAGMYFYNRQMWNEAELMFSQATELDLDRTYVLAYYNLACVLSIRLSEVPPDELGGIGWYNEILGESIDAGVAFSYLDFAVESDPARGTKARQDPDFENLRLVDPVFFDVVTLPEDQRTVFKQDLTYVSFNSFEYSISLIFSEIGHEGEEYSDSWLWFSEDNEIFKELGFFAIVPEDGWFYIDENKEMVGKRFRIEYVYQPGHSEGRGGSSIFKSPKIVSIVELQE
jgi:hypothetical protein